LKRAITLRELEVTMFRSILALTVLGLTFSASQAAFADEAGTVTGGIGGAAVGAVVGGPVGAVVGGVGGAAIGNSMTGHHHYYHHNYVYYHHHHHYE
jgi:outer membrane lipoprotein SlyB